MTTLIRFITFLLGSVEAFCFRLGRKIEECAGCERVASGMRDVDGRSMMVEQRRYTGRAMTAHGAPTLQLLGRATVSIGQRQVPFVPDKRYQLLAYLAFQGDWVSRDRLAFLFWPDTESSRARENLRGLLKRVHALEWLTDLEAGSHHIRWQVASDVAIFQKASEEQRLDEAISLYRGPLLTGMETDEGAEFAAWLELERGRFHSSWREAVFGRVSELEKAGRDREAAVLLHRLMQENDLDEEALRAYMSAVARAGQVQEALKIYRDFTRRLGEELGMEPTSTTQQLREKIQELEATRAPVEVRIAPAPAPTSADTVSSPRSSLPASGTSFIGRHVELVEIGQRLSEPECRLLTLTGPGGIGKTRLALQVARELEDTYRDGVYFVPLDALTSPAAIASTIASMLGNQLDEREPLAQLLRKLEDKQSLLVLDNFEHLLDGATLVSDILGACPELKVLVTSRERLKLEEEHLLPLEGLAFPMRAPGLDEALAYDAVQLFSQRAKRVSPHFALGEAELPHVLRICQHVQGLPLGLELAAVWVRAMPLADIAREVGQNLELLSSDSRNPRERHRSIRAVFEHSWRLLSDKERDVLAKLAVFRGGFTREAAAYVAGAPMVVLAALVDKSLLRMSPSGRYDRHPLLYQFTRGKLAEKPGEGVRAEGRHAFYFRRLAERLRSEFDGPEPGRAYGRLEAELENVRTAWQWAIEHTHLATLDACATSLGGYHFDRGQRDESIRLWISALAALDATKTAHQATVGMLMGHLAYEYALRGRWGEAEACAERGLALLRPLRKQLEDTFGMFMCFIALGIVAERRGQLHRAVALFQEQETLGLVKFRGRHLNNLGILELRAGNPTAAQDAFRQAVEHNDQDGFLAERIKSLALLGDACYHAGDLHGATSYYREAERLVRQHGPIGDDDDYALARLAKVTLEQGDPERAEDIARRVLETHAEPDDFRFGALELLGCIAIAKGDPDGASAWLRRAIEVAVEGCGGLGAANLHETWDAWSVLLHVCDLRLEQGRYHEAAALIGLFQTRLPCASDRGLLERLRSELGSVLPPQELEETLNRSASVGLNEAIAELLRSS